MDGNNNGSVELSDGKLNLSQDGYYDDYMYYEADGTTSCANNCRP